MRILLHHRTRALGAEGVHIRGIARALQDIGHEVHVVSPRGLTSISDGGSTHRKTAVRTGVFDWVSRHAPELFFEICELGYNIVGYRNIRRLLDKHHFDLVYERYAFFTWCGVFLAKKRGVPYVVEVNEVAGIERVRGQVLVPLSRFIERRVFEKADAIIVVSEFLKDRIARDRIDTAKVHVCPNATDVRMFHPLVDSRGAKQRFHLGNRITIGFTGSLLPWHNLELLFEAVREIIDEGEYDLSLLLVGEGPFRQDLEDSVAGKNLREHVVFAGAVDYSEVAELIGAMDICVIPHSNLFRSPIKLFEYMAMGKPVIAPDTRPIAQVIRHGENGFLFKVGDKDSLKRALVYLLQNKQKRTELGETARKTVCEAHTWGHNAREIVSIYERIRSKSES